MPLRPRTAPTAASAALLSLQCSGNDFQELLPCLLSGRLDHEFRASTRCAATGSFLYMPSVPQVLALDGEIKDGAEADFTAALLSHPQVTTLILNSTGGKVVEALAIAKAVKEHGLNTLILKDFGCYSACAYIFFAGADREDDGYLGVHQIYGDGVDASGAQSVLSLVLDALNDFGVSERVISVMLATPPSDIHVFSPSEIDRQAAACPSLRPRGSRSLALHLK
jgi:hypothetical protein